MLRDRRLYAVAAAYAVGLALLVFTPISSLLNALTIRLYVIWTYNLQLPGHVLPEDFGFALNIAMFVPVGLLLALVTRRPWWQVTLACVAMSAVIETVQAIPGVQRQPSLADVVSNGLGGLLGALVATWWTRRTARAPGLERGRAPRISGLSISAEPISRADRDHPGGAP